MTWTAYHHRDDVLRAVVDAANSRRDGVLPRDVEGVADTFDDDLRLVGALQLKWHTRLTGQIDRALMDYPDDFADAVIRAWQATYSELGGVRMVLDGFVAEPADDEMAHSLEVANRKDWTYLAVSAGLASTGDEQAVELGRRLEGTARTSYRRATPAPAQQRCTLVDRIKSVVAA